MLRSNRCRVKLFDNSWNFLSQYIYRELDYAPWDRGGQVRNGPDRLRRDVWNKFICNELGLVRRRWDKCSVINISNHWQSVKKSKSFVFNFDRGYLVIDVHSIFKNIFVMISEGYERNRYFVALFTWVEMELLVMARSGRSVFRHESRLCIWVFRMYLVTDSLFWRMLRKEISHWKIYVSTIWRIESLSDVMLHQGIHLVLYRSLYRFFSSVRR